MIRCFGTLYQFEYAHHGVRDRLVNDQAGRHIKSSKYIFNSAVLRSSLPYTDLYASECV